VFLLWLVISFWKTIDVGVLATVTDRLMNVNDGVLNVVNVLSFSVLVHDFVLL